jgi:cysteine desulfurase
MYLDYSSTTPVSDKVLKSMLPFFTKNFGNASTLYKEGQIARESIDQARFDISEILETEIDEIFFTSGATESNNLALLGVINSYRKKNPLKTPHIITSCIEHPSVKNVLEKEEENKDITLTKISVNKSGLVDLNEIKNAICENTILVSVMAVNNEIGTIQPVSRIGRLCRKNNILFHVDAVQAFGKIAVSCYDWKCDLLSISAHKIYGPKGVGLLYIKNGTEIEPIQKGGGQERNYRSGTENISGIVGIHFAMIESEGLREKESKRLQELQKFTKNYLEQKLETLVWNGAEIGENRVYNNCNFSIPGIDGESLVMILDMQNISISLGSACSSGLLKPSYVLEEIGIKKELLKNSIRLTFGRDTSLEGLKKSLFIIYNAIKKLRKY